MKWLKIALFASFFLFLFVLNFSTSTDFNQDLGRHLKIGEIIWHTKTIPKTNLFSYTYPSFPFINHHWLFEVFIYLFVAILPLSSLVLLKVMVILVSVGFVMWIGIKHGGVLSTIFAALIFSPLLLERSDMRPEIFGYLFFATLLLFLFNCRDAINRVSTKYYILPFIMLLWINTHITFIFGAFLILILIIKTIFQTPLLIYPSKSREAGQSWDKEGHYPAGFAGLEGWFLNNKIYILLSSFIVLLLNPNGLAAVLYPLRIFQNYGYQIAENQNMFFLNSVMLNPVIKYFFLLTPLIFITFLILLFSRKFLFSFLFLIFYFLTLFQIRHLPFFVLTAIPITAISFSTVETRLIASLQKTLRVTRYTLRLYLYAILIFLSLALSALFSTNIYFRTFDSSKTIGMQVHEDGKEGTDFLLRNTLPTNIFNGFDNGGYAIYQLFPKYRVFVDNRPEAYPAAFLQNTYIGLENNDDLRKEIFRKYSIHTVLFTHTDQTPWGINFITHILADPDWKLVYYDHYSLILTDSTRLKDIREDQAFGKQKIQNTSNHISLLRLMTLFSRLNQPQLAQQAFMKAQDINGDSCAIRRVVINQDENNPLKTYEALQLKNSSWYCY